MRTHVRDRDGFVLVSVLWILAILTVVSLGFARRAMLERQMAWYAVDREQAQQMARGAAARALFELENRRTLDYWNNQEDYTGLDQRWAYPVELFEEAQYFSESDDETFSEDTCSFVIEDCERRISINDTSRALLEALGVFGFKTINEVMARQNSESGDYQAQRFKSTEELRDLEDVSEDVWEGRDYALGLREILTVYGDGLLNVNTASREALMAIPKIERSLVDGIINYRAGKDGELYTRDDKSFTSVNKIQQTIGKSAEKLQPVRDYCKTESEYFTIRAHATRRRGNINAYCTVVVAMDGSSPTILDWKESAVGR